VCRVHYVRTQYLALLSFHSSHPSFTQIYTELYRSTQIYTDLHNEQTLLSHLSSPSYTQLITNISFPHRGHPNALRCLCRQEQQRRSSALIVMVTSYPTGTCSPKTPSTFYMCAERSSSAGAVRSLLWSPAIQQTPAPPKRLLHSTCVQRGAAAQEQCVHCYGHQLSN